MNKILSTTILLAVGILAGLLLQNRLGIPGGEGQAGAGGDDGAPVAAGDKQAGSEKKILYWVAPMDPGYRRDKPGKSPMGMDLVPVYAGDGEGGDTVTISPEVVNNLGVRTDIVRRGRLGRLIETVGYVDYDETRISHVHTRTEGWIQTLKVRAQGERVERGQHLFDLYSPSMVTAQEEFVQALDRGGAGLIRAGRQKLAALGVSAAQIAELEKTRRVRQYVSFYAPQSGVLAQLNVREGMYVKPATEVVSLASLDRIWVIAEVFERQADWVREGQAAVAGIPALPGRTWTGRVDYIYPDLDPATRTLRVRLSFANADRALMPNMYAHVRLEGGDREDVLSIPREALIRGAGSDRVILALGNGRFRAREVVSGIESGDRVAIREGLREGDRIVTSAQFLIDSEASLKASLQRMEGPPPPPAMNDMKDMKDMEDMEDGTEGRAHD